MSRFAIGAIALVMISLSMACSRGSGSTTPSERVLTSVSVSAHFAVEVGQFDTATATPLDQYGAPMVAGTVTWSSSSPTVAGVSPTAGVILAVAPGTTVITATIDGKTGQKSISVFKSPIRVNEVRPNGNAPGGWVELFNPTEGPIDLTNWTLTNGNIVQTFVLPAGTIILAGEFLVIDEAQIPGGLGATDAVHLFSRFGVQVDGLFWPGDVDTSFGRCPDRTGEFVATTAPTKGAANACPSPNRASAPSRIS